VPGTVHIWYIAMGDGLYCTYEVRSLYKQMFVITRSGHKDSEV